MRPIKSVIAELVIVFSSFWDLLFTEKTAEGSRTIRQNNTLSQHHEVDTVVDDSRFVSLSDGVFHETKCYGSVQTEP